MKTVCSSFLKEKILKVFLCISVLLPVMTLLAQKTTMKGTVLDENGTAFHNVTVEAMGQGSQEKKATITDEKGMFVFNQLTAGRKYDFRFSYSDYEIQVIKAFLIEKGDNNSVLVRMKPGIKVLDDVVVMGYGPVRKKDFTGSVSQLGSKDVAERQTTQVSSSLQGALSGVTVTRTSSAPGAGATVRVRGITSMRNNDPLIVVDGVPVNSINDVSPNDVETITVLKDAASASIYGARAASGVVLIATKRGAGAAVKIDYNYTYARDKASAMPDYADAVTYMKIVNEREWNQSGAVAGVNEHSIYDEALINNYWKLNAENPDQYPNTDWAKLILHNSAPRQSHQLSISTGKTRVSFAYDKADGLYKANLDWNRFMIRVNNNISFNKWLEAIADVQLRKTNSITPAYSPAYQMRYAAPVYAGLYSDGRLAGGKDGTNPYGAMMYGGSVDNNSYLLNGKFGLNIKPIKDLVISGVFAPIYTFVKEKSFSKRVPYYAQWDDVATNGYLEGTVNMNLVESRNDNHSYTSQLFANYNKLFGGHSLSIMAGYENYYYYNETLMASRGQYTMPDYPYLVAGPGDIKDNDGDAYENAYRSMFGRLMYNWKSRYFIQLNVRRDGSSRFHRDHRWGTFPSVSAGWMLSQEKFIKDALPFVSSLKLRGSWGQLGDERIGNYTYQSYISFNSPTLYTGNTPTAVQGASAYQYAIKNNTWETTTTSNIGLDASFLNGRLRVSGDYYRKDTRDMLIQVNIPVFMGYSDPYQNVGEMHTKGWDADLGWQDDRRGFQYGISINISDYKSVMGYIRNTQQDNKSSWTLIREGDEYLSYYGYLSDGIYQKGDVPGAVTSSVVSAGDIRYKDVSGPDKTPDGIINDYDRVPLGGSLPRFNYGGRVTMQYKGFDLLVVFQGVGKQKSVITTQMSQPIRADWYNVPGMIVGNYWSNYNSDEQNRAAVYPRIMRDANANNYVASDFWLFNGSYFRVKNITLGYNFPSTLVNKMYMRNLRVFISAQDIFTRSKYAKGWDPEVSDTGYPITRSFLFGISAGL
ncbi:SusC/RagA family TonB-linked outer membrane protein [Filimonas effusa]|uniref:TonB-dependent receptor n=1 Tax=Filimonas effusa TaxID=2508721 RepID=A0A4Q1D8G9_9BACT|nr:TonB-dependent receptor [Filimonas effusa]RXK85634.1 TonB-dependent receptor [Filimonas effusa]